MTLKEWIYEAVTGQLDDDELSVYDIQVESEFGKRSVCGKLYDEVYETKKQLCRKLHVEESLGLEKIVDNMTEIMRIVGLKMYDYGAELAQKETDAKQE